MGLLTNRVKRTEIKPGDHIYTYRTVFAYSHHGIYVGGSIVVHFTSVGNSWTSTSNLSTSIEKSYDNDAPQCQTFPDCGFKNNGVVLSCLDCFLSNGSLYRYEYNVSPSIFIAKVRGGTTTAASDPPDAVIRRANYLLHNGFGSYDLLLNNCEDFAMYCKTGLLTLDRKGVGRSGQATTMFGAPIVALLSSSLKLVMPSPVVATVSAGMFCMSRYAADIGVRDDVVKVAVEDLGINLGLEKIVEDIVSGSMVKR